MSFATVLSKLLNKDTEARVAADCGYLALVIDAANDRNVTEARITATIAAAGKSLADLQAAVGVERQRIADLSVAARRGEILDALHENNQAMIAEDSRYADEVARLFQDHGRKVAELRERDRVLSADLQRVEAAERRLIAGCDRLQQIGEELRDLANKEQRLASNSLKNDRACQRQRDEIVANRSELVQERDEIRKQIITSN
jgi:lambda repressor-like predicted transcriptional regulator